MARSARALLVAAFGLLLAASDARADDGYDAALRDGVAARDRALETRDERDWQQAFEHFERAIKVNATVEARFELGEAAAQLQLTDVAYEAYAQAVSKGLSGKARARAQAFLEAHAGEIARIEVAAPSGTTVYVNGRERGALPFEQPLVVSAGRVQLRLVQRGAAPWEKALDVEAQVVMRVAPDVGAPKEAPPRVESRSWFATPGAITLVAVASASLATGGVLYLLSSDRQDDADDARAQLLEARQTNVDNGVLDPRTAPCGELFFTPDVPDTSKSYLSGAFSNACARFGASTDSAKNYETAAYISLGVGAAATMAVLIGYVLHGNGPTTPGADHAVAARRLPVILPVASARVQGLWMNFEF